MAAFVYKFETVKKVKEELKNKAQKILADVENQIEECKNDITNFKNELIEIRNSSSNSGTKISEIIFNKGCQLVIEKRIESYNLKLIQLKTKREKALKDLTQKSKEHKIFDTYENNCREKFKKEQDKNEMNMLDEIAVQKFVRQAK